MIEEEQYQYRNRAEYKLSMRLLDEIAAENQKYNLYNLTQHNPMTTNVEYNDNMKSEETPTTEELEKRLQDFEKKLTTAMTRVNKYIKKLRLDQRGND